MPYSKTQLERIMSKRGQAFVPSAKLNYAGRICETVVRRRVYSWEDKTAFKHFYVLRDLYQEIQRYALEVAARFRIHTLANDENGLMWRRLLLSYAEEKLISALSQCAYDAYQAATTAYVAGYYGRLWLMDMTTHKTAAVFKPSLNRIRVAQSVLQPTLHEAVIADYGGYQAYGQDWQEQYATVAQNAIVKLRRLTSTSLSQQETVYAALNAIAQLLGVKGKAGDVVRGTYYEAQLLTRAAIIRASNHGSVYAMQAQMQPAREAEEVRWLLGALFVSSHDDRVCPICRRLDGNVYVINSLFGIALFGLPPDNTHLGCRCTVIPWVIPIEGEEETPPEQTWDEWLSDEFIYSELSDFMTDTQWDSTQL